MSAITPYQHLEAPASQTPQPARGNRFSQRKWTLLKPQETLCKNLCKLVGGQALFAVIAQVLLANAVSIELTVSGCDTLNQASNAGLLAAIFTGASALCAYGYFAKSNKEEAAKVTPEMKTEIRNQIAATREQEVLQEERAE